MTLYTDGASRGNPGPAGIGVILLDNDNVVYQGCEYLGEKTNNEAEYLALIYGLEEASKHTKKLKVFSDSLLLVSQIKGDFKIKKDNLKTLHARVKELTKLFDYFTISHTYRENNKKADKMANTAIDEFTDGKRQIKTFDFLYCQDKLF
ncbi:MAG: reverse transcriptase-like protein [Actinobacteria bacterium]|nr:MAG: reverse transcriptase-like protein [Actinomycetota bacterium]